MFFRIFNIVFVLLFFSSILFSQEKTRMLLSLDRNSSLFNNAKINTIGLKVGYKYGCKFNMGLGFYTTNNIMFDYTSERLYNIGASTSLEAKLSYVNFFVEPIILKEKRKFFSTPISFGGGNLRVKYRELNSKNRKTYFNSFVPVFNMSGIFMVKLIPFVWIGGGFGYRHIFHKDNIVNDNFNSLYYVIKLKIGRPCKKTSSFYKWRKKLFKKDS